MKHIKSLFMLLSIVVATTACNLDKFPTTAIASDQAFQTMNDAGGFRNGLYAYFRSVQYGIFSYTTDLQTDLFNATTDFGNRNGMPHRMDDNWSASDYTVDDVWQFNYAAIAQTNNVIENIFKCETKTAADVALLKRYYAEACYFRAFYYLKLMNTYCDAYNTATAAIDLGVPLVLKYDVSAKPARASAKDVFTQILKDLDEAERLFTEIGATNAQNSVRLTPDAITALKARAYLNMRDNTKAAAAADILITSNRYPLVTTLAALQNTWYSDASTEDLFRMFASEQESVNTNGIFIGYNSANKKNIPDFIPTQRLLDLYEPSDLRKAVFYKDSIQLSGTDFPNVKFLNKFPGNIAYRTPAAASTPTNYRHQPKVARIAEMYLIKAEAGNDLAALNTLRAARGASAIAAANLAQEIRNEYAREFVGEGLYLDALKRAGVGYTNRPAQNITAVSNSPASAYTERVVPADYYKFSWPIPRNELVTNVNMVQSPRWLAGN